MNAFTNFPTTKAMMLGVGLLFAQAQPTWAQVSGYNQQTPPATNSQNLTSSVATYRDDVRHSVLQVSQYPQVLDKLAQQQANSEQAFSDLIRSYGQTKQGWFYDIARFPDVLHNLAALPIGADQATVQDIAKTLPATLQETAWKLYRNHHNDLVRVDNLNQQADQSFTDLIAPLDVPAQAAFRQLINMPDVLSLLTQQLDETTKLGQAYQADPDAVAQNLADQHEKIDAQNKQDLAEYQRQLDQDPQARQELEQAGKAYAQANGINPNPAWPNNPVYYGNPYSYWFGYPGWYGSPMWYPYGTGFGTGFYYGLGGNMIVYGLPSFGFSNWFFNYGYGYYPHLYSRFNTYYNTYTTGARGFRTPGNGGFYGAARRAYGPVNGYASSRVNGLGNVRPYSGGNARVAAPQTRYQGMNSGGYRTPSWGGGARSFGGSSSFGGGMRSFGGGGGFHGGGRR